MSEKIKAAFLVVAPEADKKRDRAVISSSVVELITVMVNNYDEAKEEAKNLLNEGVKVIELCGGFGNKGVEIISEAVLYKIPVGVVRFDSHPAFEGASGDKLFG